MQFLYQIISRFEAYTPFDFSVYTPLITSDDFDPVRADVTTAAVGIISLVLIVIGLGILVRVLSR
jgi:hypothetical protein